MPYVTGIDLSMCSTGIGQLWFNDEIFEVQTHVVKSKGSRQDTVVDRSLRIKDLRDRICSYVGINTRLVVLESPSFGSQGAGTWDRAGLWWAVVNWLTGHDVPVALVSPLSLKKWISNNGKASKAQVQDAIENLFGFRPKTNDEADGLSLAHAGAFALDYDLPTADWQTIKTQPKAEWPWGRS